MAKWNKKKHSGSKGGAGGGNAKGKGTMRKGGKNNFDRQEKDLVNDDRGAGGAALTTHRQVRKTLTTSWKMTILRILPSVFYP